MTGLDKMISQIIDEAQANAETIANEADKKADKIIAEAKSNADVILRSGNEKASKDAAAYIERARSSADLKKRTQLLKKKQEIIADVLDGAYDSLTKLDDASYFEVIQKMIVKYAQPKSGSICFSKTDLDRLPADFEQTADSLAKNNGGSLTLYKEAGRIENGFILIYGGIEENCTFRALFDAQKEYLQDIVNKELFG